MPASTEACAPTLNFYLVLHLLEFFGSWELGRPDASERQGQSSQKFRQPLLPPTYLDETIDRAICEPTWSLVQWPTTSNQWNFGKVGSTKIFGLMYHYYVHTYHIAFLRS